MEAATFNGRLQSYYGQRLTQPSFYVRRVDDELKLVAIVDLSEARGCRTITNAADEVVEIVNKDYPGYRIVYLDTDGNWDELQHNNGRFLGFKPCKDRSTGEVA